MQPSSNRILFSFKHSTAPDVWTSKQAKRVFDAAIEQETSGAYAAHAVSGSIKCDIAQPRDSIMSDYGTHEDAAATKARRHIAKLRHEADRLERELTCYGGQSFVAHREVVRAPSHPFDAQALILGILSRPGLRSFEVHGVRFARDASSAFVRTDKVGN